MSPLEDLSARSFLSNGHEYHLYSYGPVEPVPDGVKLKDAAEILPAEEIFHYTSGPGAGSVSAFSNYFRYKLLHDKGGFWVDTDVICVKPFNFRAAHVFGQERSRFVPYSVASCVIKAPAGSKFTQFCLDEFKKLDRLSLKWGVAGPALVTRAVQELNLYSSVLPPEVFCPSDWWRVDQEMVGSLGAEVNLDATHAVHMWHEMWRRNKFDKYVKHHRNSLFEILKRRYKSIPLM
mgnify:FL=1